MKISPRFIAIDGPNGVGKSSIIEGLKVGFQERLNNFTFTKEPTTTCLGSFIRSNHDQYTAKSLAALVAADRYDHLEKTIIPDLQAGRTVITERYIASSLVYQLLDGLSIDFVMKLNSEIILPELYFLLTGEVQKIQTRLNTRSTLTRFEKNNQLNDELRLYEGAGDYLKSWGVNVVQINNTGQSIESTIMAIINEITKLSM